MVTLKEHTGFNQHTQVKFIVQSYRKSEINEFWMPMLATIYTTTSPTEIQATTNSKRPHMH